MREKTNFEIRLSGNYIHDIGEWGDNGILSDCEKREIVLNAMATVLSNEFPDYEFTVYSYPKEFGDDWDGLLDDVDDAVYIESGQILIDLWDEIGNLMIDYIS